MSTSVSLATFSDNSVNASVTRDDMAIEEVGDYLDGLVDRILEHRGVNHPFLNDYRTTRLTKEQERKLYLETYYYFLHVPFYICSLCVQTRDENVMRQVLANVADEFGMSGTKPHSEIFLEFMENIGITRESIAGYRCLPTTTTLNKGIEALYRNPPFTKALGALFAEETQSAAMVEKYNAGLDHNGHDASVRNFWTMHIQAEVGHSNAVFNCMAPYLRTEEDRRLFEEGVEDYMQLLEAYWDGIRELLDAT